MGFTLSDRWIDRLQQVSMPAAQQALCLSLLGLPEESVGRMLSCDVETIRGLNKEAVALCADSRAEASDSGYAYDIDLVGRQAMQKLLSKPRPPVAPTSFEFEWKRAQNVFSIAKGEDGEYYADYEEHRPQFRLELEEPFCALMEEIRQLFISKEPSKELIILLPLAVQGLSRWDVLTLPPCQASRDDSLRLLFALSSLGFGYRESGHRTKFFSDLVWGCETLFEQIAVSGARGKNQHVDKNFQEMASGLSSGSLILRSSQTCCAMNSDRPVEVFAANFTSAWRGSSERFSNWSIRDRAQDADDVADALLWLMVHSSGVCIRVPLAPRASRSTPHDVQVIAPTPWISFLRQGHGALRGKEIFEPYKNVRDGVSPLFHVDEPTRYAELRQQRLSRK